MKAALLCGPCPPGACGVGDYTIRLAGALNQKGIEADVISSRDMNLLGVVKHRERRSGEKFDVVHIQYPTVGFGAALGPQGLALIRSSVVTIHEASGARFLRKLALLPFSIRPKQLVFTSEREREFAVKWVPWISRSSRVIPITSNIRTYDGPRQPTADEILHFGLIMPNKGLESVIALGKLVKDSGLSFRIRVVGSCPPRHATYFEDLKSKTSTLPIIWDTGLTEQQVARRLASSSIAYLPYPDGVSERRATFKAALLSGVTVITTRGQHTPSSLDGIVSFCANPEEALVAARFLAQNEEERAKLADRAQWYAREFTWDSIAQAHFTLYSDMLAARCDGKRIAFRSPERDNHWDSKSV